MPRLTTLPLLSSPIIWSYLITGGSLMAFADGIRVDLGQFV